jgi:hypothetical protein
LLFLIVHAIYVPVLGHAGAAPPGLARRLPERIQRHSLAARLHWIMAAAMFVLLFTAFLPMV